MAPVIGHCTKRVVGEVTGVLFFLDGLFSFLSLSNFLGNLAVLLIVRSVPRFPRGAQWGVYFGIVVCALVLWYLVVLTRRVRAPGRQRQRAGVFFGLAPIAKQCGVKKIVRLFCGVALVGLSLVIYHYLAWVPLCVHHRYQRIMWCETPDGQGHCTFFYVDHIDARCSGALTLWPMNDPGPMEEIWREEARRAGFGSVIIGQVDQKNPRRYSEMAVLNLLME